MMPSFDFIPDMEKKAILAFLLKTPEKEATGPVRSAAPLKVKSEGAFLIPHIQWLDMTGL
jgi:quinoprotein glucose dehydrogenase